MQDRHAPPAFAGQLAHEMTGRMEYLLGTRPRLEQVWKAWGITVHTDRATPDRVEHSALLSGITWSGLQATLSPANFNPAWAVHDVPLLASRCRMVRILDRLKRSDHQPTISVTTSGDTGHGHAIFGAAGRRFGVATYQRSALCADARPVPGNCSLA